MKEFYGATYSMAGIKQPERTLLLVDSGYSIITWWHAADSPPYRLSSKIEDTAYIPGMKINVDKKLWFGQEEDAIEGRHPGKTVNQPGVTLRRTGNRAIQKLERQRNV